MKYFFETTETIADGLGFSLLDSLHISWLIAMVILVVGNCFLYRKLTKKEKRIGEKRWHGCWLQMSCSKWRF